MTNPAMNPVNVTTTTVTTVATVTTVEPAMLPRRAVLDVAELPDVEFGPRDIMWWGTFGFVVIEGFTLALCTAVYLYLWKNFDSWPPRGTPLPGLGVPTVQVIAMALSIPVVAWTQRSAHRFEFGRVRLGLTLATLFAMLFIGLRAWELLHSLNVKWDANAYGSAQWLILGAHATLLAVELVEVGGMALIFWIAPVEKKHFSDSADISFYWYFMVGVWFPLYVICFWLPRWY